MIRCSASCYCLSMYRGRGSLVVVELLCVLVGGMSGWCFDFEFDRTISIVRHFNKASRASN